MAQLIKTDGTVIDNVGVSLEELQQFVGGYIEICYLPNGKTLIMNEEGKMMGLPVNEKASQLYGRDKIVGDVVVCNQNEFK